MDNAQTKRILVIDQDADTRAQVQLFFAGTEIHVVVAASAEEGPRTIYEQQPQLILCDRQTFDLPEGEIIAYLQDLTDAPVIWLASSAAPQDIARGLDAGAIDYLVKPLEPLTVVARVRVAFRQLAANQSVHHFYADGYLKLDPHSQRVFVSSQEIRLTAVERRLLFFLFDHADEVCTFEEILEHVWGWEFQGSNQYVHTYMSRLRHKVEASPQQPIYLLSEHGAGYQFRKNL